MGLGSPPPMRGKGTSRIIPKLIVRITPAYAGKSLQAYFSMSSSSGSPPPMRGKVRMHEGKLAMDRITPAYAGKRKR